MYVDSQAAITPRIIPVSSPLKATTMNGNG